MTRRPLTLRPVALAAAASLLPALALAQQAPQAPAGDGLKLDTVVITGTSTARTKMKQSVSVSTIDGESLQNTVASSATDVLRTVPGLRAESSGGEGNANLGVRGLPMSDGGGRYVQLQEDGLPVLLIGDISFATADQFVRADFMTDGVDAIRGGSSATLATNAPGAIVNFRSKTGKAAGGALGFSTGLDHRQLRLDFAYGGKLGEGLSFQMGGFFRHGEGPRNTDVTLENGGQFRANLTKDLGQGSYLRVNFKSLHDKTPTFLPVPVVANGSKIQPIAGIDPRTAFFVNSKFASDLVVDKNGNRVATNPADGLNVKVDSIGVEGQFNLGGGLQITERLRKSAISGRFIGVFPAGSQPADYSGAAKVFSAHIFNSALDDMGNVFNDLRVTKEMPLAAGSKLTLVGGLFNGQQNVAQTWYWNRYNIGLSGDGSGIYSNTGSASTGAVGDATTTWGGCCFRNIDVRVTATAPYAALTYEQGALSIDASVRHDKQKGSGTQKFGSATTGTWDPARLNTIGWRSSATSYSLGANVELQRSMAVFARASRGASWKSPDRVVWDLDIDSGKAPYPVNKIDQFEAGLKYRGAGFSAFITAFLAKTQEGAGYELTTQTVKNNDYDAKGIEAEFSTAIGPVRLIGGATLTDAEISSGSNQGKTPRRQARLVYQLSPSYVIGAVELGASIVGTTKSYAQDDNVVELPGYTTVNAYLNYEMRENLTLQLGVNNLFNTLAYTEAEVQNNLGTNPLYIARALNGRSARLAVRYSF